MSRSVISYEHRLDATPGLAAGAKAPPPEDKYNERLLKYIPAEAITLYLTLMALLSTQADLPWWLGWAVFVVGIAATWYYLRFLLDVKGGVQLTISCVAFVIWVFALGGPFKELAWYRPIYGALILPIYTFFIARVKTPPQQAA